MAASSCPGSDSVFQFFWVHGALLKPPTISRTRAKRAAVVAATQHLTEENSKKFE
jgi:hypothetical protein